MSKKKMDVAEFIEYVLGVELSETQKMYIKHVYSKVSSGSIITIVPARNACYGFLKMTVCVLMRIYYELYDSEGEPNKAWFRIMDTSEYGKDHPEWKERVCKLTNDRRDNNAEAR